MTPEPEKGLSGRTRNRNDRGALSLEYQRRANTNYGRAVPEKGLGVVKPPDDDPDDLDSIETEDED